jgi:hypothetical protein
VNAAVVEVGPQTVRGPEPVARERISVAIECIDDNIALLGGRLVEVRQLWSDLLEAAAGECGQTLVLVFPTSSPMPPAALPPKSIFCNARRS